MESLKAFAATFLILAVLVMAVFGLYMPFSTHSGHDMPCPFGHGSAMCSSVSAHVGHWLSTIAVILSESAAFAGIACILLLRLYDPVLSGVRYARVAAYASAPRRPELLTELFSQGILNRKEPQVV